MPPRRRDTPRIDSLHLEGRTGEIWRAYVAGESQEAIAKRHGISQQRVSQILTAVRESIPEPDRAALVLREIEFLDGLRRQALAIAERGPIPAYSQGRAIYLDDGTQAQDYGGVFAAMDRAVKAHERLSKLLGLDAASKVEATVVERTEADAAIEALLAEMDRRAREDAEESSA